MINLQKSNYLCCWPALLIYAVLLSSCNRSEPNISQIKDYIENYHVAHDYLVASMEYEVVEGQGGQFGSIRVYGQLELREPMYVEDVGYHTFRQNVADALARNRFSEREINHDIYDRVIRASARMPNSDSDYFTFLKVEHERGFEINFSADLTYKISNDGFVLDGPLRHALLLGNPMAKFSNPVVDDSELVNQAVKNVLSEQTRYSELMKESRALLTQLWDNDFGFVIWNRKLPYLGSENLDSNEQSQLTEFKDWRGVYHISNVKPVQFRTPRASNFFELGFYTTEGIATCLRQTGFIDELIFLKSRFDQYCEFGKQYPVFIKLGSTLDETNAFIASVQFEVNGVNSGELLNNSSEYRREHNELARYSDQKFVTMLRKGFDITQHVQAVFALADYPPKETERLSLSYNVASSFDPVDVNKGLAEHNVADIRSINEIGALDSDAKASLDVSSTGPQTEEIDSAETLMVKAIQTELKRLGVYSLRIDGIAGEYTYWGMKHVQERLGRTDMKIPSSEFLVLLRESPIDSIEPPEAAFEPSKPEQKKKTLIGNAFRWVGNQFKKKGD
ncbi:MAG: peptidoglycan-binding protein [Arenicella sp.]|nr:peptidoglycan-binding protein [Arenicella sp.]